MFSVFTQYYIYFYTLFHLHVFSKNTNNVTRTMLPNGSWIVKQQHMNKTMLTNVIK